MANTIQTHMKNNTLPLVHFFLAFIMLLIGGTLGLLQGLNRGGVFELPASFNYYEVLTLHGILLILAFTTLFTNGYLYAAIRHTLGELSKTVKVLAWSSLASFLIGSVLVVWMVLAGEATVMYTFYPPMQASPWFYIGLVFVVLCIWLAGLGVFISAFQWKRRNKGQHLPILAFFAVGIYTLVIFGSIGVTVEVLMLIPWAFGWTETINVMLSRTLFWSFGHTLVNVWYLVAISVWYTILPKIIGGRIFSDTLARLVVILIVILNVPGGFHHQIVDPAFSEGLKFMHVFMSLSIAFPSLMTAFAMFAVLERTGRKRGGRGLLGWLWVLPWGDVRFLTIMIAMISFIIGGAGGIAQTNNQLNQVVHNSLWVVGHFHITVGVTVVMTILRTCLLAHPAPLRPCDDAIHPPSRHVPDSNLDGRHGTDGTFHACSRPVRRTETDFLYDIWGQRHGTRLGTLPILPGNRRHAAVLRCHPHRLHRIPSDVLCTKRGYTIHGFTC